MAESIQGALDRAVAKLPAIIRSAVQRMGEIFAQSTDATVTSACATAAGRGLPCSIRACMSIAPPPPAELEEFTLGVNPPLFGNTTALFDAQTNYLRFETQLSFVSSGMQAILRPVLAGLPDVVQASERPKHRDPL